MNDQWEESAKLKWNESALSWHQRSENNWETGSRKDILPFLHSYIHSELHILDGGCGSGYGTYKLACAGANIIGIDFSGEMIKHAIECYDHPHLKFMQGELTNLSFAPSTFQMILLINSLEWVANPLEVIQKLTPLLTDDGYICASILGPSAGPREHSFERLLGNTSICNTMMPWEYDKLMILEGYHCIKEQGIYGNISTNLLESLSKKHQQSLCFSWLSLYKKSKGCS